MRTIIAGTVNASLLQKVQRLTCECHVPDACDVRVTLKAEAISGVQFSNDR